MKQIRIPVQQTTHAHLLATICTPDAKANSPAKAPRRTSNPPTTSVPIRTPTTAAWPRAGVAQKKHTPVDGAAFGNQRARPRDLAGHRTYGDKNTVFYLNRVFCECYANCATRPPYQANRPCQPGKIEKIEIKEANGGNGAHACRQAAVPVLQRDERQVAELEGLAKSHFTEMTCGDRPVLVRGQPGGGLQGSNDGGQKKPSLWMESHNTTEGNPLFL